MQKIRLKNQRGLELATVVHIPESPVNGKFPATILLHGFTGYKDEGHIATLADALADKGVLAIRFDASGYGESEGALERDYRLSHYISDTDIVYQYLVSRDDVDSSRIGVWGHSMGGIVVVVFTATHQNVKLACVISSPHLMGTTDRVGKALPEWKRTGWYERKSSRYGLLRIPYAFIEDARTWNVYDYLSKMKAPILFMWGTKDVNVRPEQTKEIFEKANPPKEFLEIEGMDHFYKNNPILLKQVNGAVVKFVLENL